MPAINVQMGPATVEYGTDLDKVVIDVTKGGIVFSSEMAKQDITVDQFGDAPISSIKKGLTASLTVPFVIYDLERLSKAFPDSELVKNGDKVKLVAKGGSGFNLMSMAKKVVVKPTDPTSTPNDWITIPLAAPNIDLELTYDSETERIYNVTFTGYPDLDNGNVLFILGDETVTAP